MERVEEIKVIYQLEGSALNGETLEVDGYFGALEVALEKGMRDGCEVEITDQMWAAGRLFINKFTIKKNGVELIGRRKV